MAAYDSTRLRLRHVALLCGSAHWRGVRYAMFWLNAILARGILTDLAHVILSDLVRGILTDAARATLSDSPATKYQSK